jgi:UDP-N-acetylglucosamine 3-dehydrogenase
LSKPAIGVIGIGYWGAKIAREYLTIQRKFGTMRLAAICDSRQEQVQTFRSRIGYPRKRTFSNPQDFLKSGVHGVHICTPNSTHYEIASSALDEGKAVLVEKPMTISYRDAQGLVKKGADLNLPVIAGHIYRFNNGVKWAAQIIQRGTLGDISHLDIEWKAFATFHDSNSDILFDLGPHAFDITNMLIGEWPLHVKYSSSDPRRTGINEIAYLHASYKDRKTAHIELNWAYPAKTRSVSVIGQRKSIHIDCLNQIITMYSGSARPHKIGFRRNNAMRSELLYFGKCCAQLNDSMGIGDIALKVVGILDKTRRQTS